MGRQKPDEGAKGLSSTVAPYTRVSLEGRIAAIVYRGLVWWPVARTPRPGQRYRVRYYTSLLHSWPTRGFLPAPFPEWVVISDGDEEEKDRWGTGSGAGR